MKHRLSLLFFTVFTILASSIVKAGDSTMIQPFAATVQRQVVVNILHVQLNDATTHCDSGGEVVNSKVYYNLFGPVTGTLYTYQCHKSFWLSDAPYQTYQAQAWVDNTVSATAIDCPTGWCSMQSTKAPVITITLQPWSYLQSGGGKQFVYITNITQMYANGGHGVSNAGPYSYSHAYALWVLLSMPVPGVTPAINASWPGVGIIYFTATGPGHDEANFPATYSCGPGGDTFTYDLMEKACTLECGVNMTWNSSTQKWSSTFALVECK